MQKHEGGSYFEQKAIQDRQRLKREDELRSRIVQLRHGTPSGQLTLQQQIALSLGLQMPLQEGINRKNSRKHSKGKKKKRK